MIKEINSIAKEIEQIISFKINKPSLVKTRGLQESQN